MACVAQSLWRRMASQAKRVLTCVVALSMLAAPLQPVQAQTATESYAADKVKDVRDEVFAKSAAAAAGRLTTQAAEMKAHADFLYAAARDMDERGIRGAYFAATTSSPQLKAAAAKLTTASNQLYNNAQAASLMAESTSTRASRVATFAKSVPYIAAALQTAWDSWTLYRDASQMQARYPNLPLRATRIEYVETVFSAAVGLIPYVGQIVAALAVEQTAWEAYDLMPNENARARSWIATMEASASGYRGTPTLEGWKKGTGTIPPGLLQYLKACHQINSDEVTGLSNLAWTKDWSVDPGVPNATGTVINARSVWNGATIKPTTLALSVPPVVTVGGTAQYTLRATNASATPSPALVVKNSAGTDVMISTFQTRSSSNGADVWSYSGALQLSTPGRYSAVARAIGVDGKSAESAAVAFTLQAAPAPTGSVDNAARLSAKVGETLQLFGKVSNAEVVYVDFYTAAATTPLRERAEVNKVAGTWARPRAFTVAGNFTYQVRAEDAITKALTDLGSRLAIDITDVVTPPPPTPTPAPSISAAQALSPLQLNQAASFGLTGSNLSAATPPRVSLAGCDGPVLTVVSATSARFTCTPRVIGAARLFWKLPGTDNKEYELGQFTVMPASADGMLYVSDTPADNQLYDGGATFTKTWQLKNTGTTTWTSAWCLRPQDGPALGTAAVCVVGTVLPGAVYNFGVPMTMPAGQASQVSLRQNWRLENVARVQVGPQIYASVQVKAKLSGLRVVEPFTMPDSVRVNTEWWVGSLKLSGAASQVRMQLTGPQGALTPFSWTAATADQWSMQYRFPTAGDYSWTLSVQGATGTDSRSGTVRVLSAIVAVPVVTPMANARVEVGKPWALEANTSVVSSAVLVQFAGEPAVRMATTDNRRFTLTRSFAAAGPQTYSVQAMFPNAAAQTLQGSVQVDAVTPLPPVALNPLLTRSASVQALLPWSATLRTDAPVYQADLVFRTGRRIPFDGGPMQWATRDENSRFTDAGNYDYELQLRRTAASALEVFPGGTLEVRPMPLPANPPRINSAASVEQGQPYNLTVQTAASADKVTVRWPDQTSEQGLRPLDAARTQWEFGNRLFPTAGAQAYTVRSYKDGFTQPTGELPANLQVTVPSATMRLLEISRNIVKGEKPYFTVEASLVVTQVTVKLGSLAAVPLVGSGPNGAVQNFRARVPVAEAGTVPYAITGYNAQGQAVGSALTGTVPVADVGDALTVPNPVPAELQRGQAVAWMFRTAQAPNEMWAEFSAPIGTLSLTGYYLNHSFNFPAGSYTYRVMRRDHLGNVFAIQGAAGSLRIKDVVQVAVPTAQVQVNPNPGQVGQAVQFSVQLSSGLDVARLEWVFPSTGALQVVQTVPMRQTGAATWALAQAFTSTGSRSSQLKVTMSDGRSAVLGGVVVTTAAAAPAYMARVEPASVRVGQSMGFAVQVADPASVARAELVFTDVNVTEALVQTAANTWARTRPMAQAGANRPYLVRLLLKSGATAQVNGTYTVTP